MICNVQYVYSILLNITLRTTFHVIILNWDYFMMRGGKGIVVLVKPCKLSFMLSHVVM